MSNAYTAVKLLMPGWLVSLVLAAVVAVALLAFGSSLPVKVFAVMFGWFLVLGALGLGVEALWQLARGRWRRHRRGPSVPLY